MQEEWEWSEKQFEERLIGFATAEGHDVFASDELEVFGGFVMHRTGRGGGRRNCRICSSFLRRRVGIPQLMAGAGALATGMLPGSVGVESGISVERGLRAVQNHGWQKTCHEDGDEVECPLPAQDTGNLSNNDWREESSSKQRQISQSHTLAALVNKIQISYGYVDQGFEWRQSNSLKYPRSHEGVEVLVACATPCRANDDEDASEEIEMSLSPNAS